VKTVIRINAKEAQTNYDPNQ